MKQIWRYNRTYRQTRGRIVCRFLFVLFLTSYFIVWISNTIKWTNVQRGVCAYLFIRFVIYYHDADSHSALSIVFGLHSDLLLLNACIWHWSDATAEIKIDDKCTFFCNSLLLLLLILPHLWFHSEHLNDRTYHIFLYNKVYCTCYFWDSTFIQFVSTWSNRRNISPPHKMSVFPSFIQAHRYFFDDLLVKNDADTKSKR